MTEEKILAELCSRSRTYLEALVNGAAPELPTADLAPIEGAAGLFVIVRERGSGEVRGAVGTTNLTGAPDDLLPALIRDAATDDPRNPPVRADELADVDLELWLLMGPPRPIREVEEIDPRVDALRIAQGIRTATLLPDVALAKEWSAQTCLAYACRKAGLPAGAWRRQETRVEALRTIHATC
ncbi:AMMECR1 domain-containing protein [Vulgatibacter incomptus]|uniref:AMMECR1 domain-containing protein n=1 Tax=Vulgatibacter incomptus TaxID=1391653 RepID=A0A0K1PAA6_9BACT|nr:AMMECR1 domain-containing protein [Vulgatibacter incomptus]AKU90049.1 hypothetical protein AKJ08_0436 [Vulgatibacter incomptus]